MTLTLKDPIVVAFIRGTFISVLLAGAAFFEADTEPWKAAGTIFFGAMLLRFGAEGAWDQIKNRSTVRVDRPGFNDPVPPEMIVHRTNAATIEPEPQANWPETSFPGPIPPIDFDWPYHYGRDEKTRHPGSTGVGCPWCIAESKTAT